MAARYHLIAMKPILLSGIISAMLVAAATACFGFTIAVAQMADNATMGNMTGGNMTAGGGNWTDNNSTETSGSISGIEDPFS
jgi:hypothetical protein